MLLGAKSRYRLNLGSRFKAVRPLHGGHPSVRVWGLAERPALNGMLNIQGDRRKTERG